MRAWLCRTNFVLAFAACAASWGGAACGDDDVAPRDGGASDSGRTDDAATPSEAGAGDAGVGDSGAAGVCPTGACDLLAQTGCGEGEACYFASRAEGEAPAPSCLAVETAGAIGAACEFTTDCAAGLLCAQTSATSRSCRAYCCNGGGCPGDQVCGVRLQDEAGQATGVGFCVDCVGCDLVEQDCGNDDGCYPSGDGCSLCITPTARAEEGAACGTANSCAPGLACVPIDGMSKCRKICEVGVLETGCADGQRCVTFGYTRPEADHAGFCYAASE